MVSYNHTDHFQGFPKTARKLLLPNLESKTVANGKNVSKDIWSLLMAELPLKYKSTHHREMRLKVKIKAQDAKVPTGKIQFTRSVSNHLTTRRP